MSMKRTKQRSPFSRNSDDEIAPVFRAEKEGDDERTWAELTEGKPDESFAPYALASRFERGALIQHPKFGRGAVVAVVGTHIDVVFADGKKKLGHAGPAK